MMYYCHVIMTDCCIDFYLGSFFSHSVSKNVDSLVMCYFQWSYVINLKIIVTKPDRLQWDHLSFFLIIYKILHILMTLQSHGKQTAVYQNVSFSSVCSMLSPLGIDSVKNCLSDILLLYCLVQTTLPCTLPSWETQ